MRAVRIDRELKQWDVDNIMGAHRGFCNELEMGHRTNSIYVLHKAFRFLGYIPNTLSLKEDTGPGKLYTHRIKNGFSLSIIAQTIGLDKSTLRRFEIGKNTKPNSKNKIQRFIDEISQKYPNSE